MCSVVVKYAYCLVDPANVESHRRLNSKHRMFCATVSGSVYKGWDGIQAKGGGSCHKGRAQNADATLDNPRWGSRRKGTPELCKLPFATQNPLLLTSRASTVLSSCKRIICPLLHSVMLLQALVAQIRRRIGRLSHQLLLTSRED